jgi:hypothetical protein
MTTYKLNRAAFREEILNAPWMVGEMERRAELGHAFAESIAPDAPPIGEGYIKSFVIFKGRDGGIHGDRAYAELANYSPHALFVEFGTDTNEAHHVLTRAMEVMGG